AGVAVGRGGAGHAPTPRLLGFLKEHLLRGAGSRVYRSGLGTPRWMAGPAVAGLGGMPAAERDRRYPGVRVFNHNWDRDDALVTIGTITAAEADALTGGLLARDVVILLNRLVEDYDLLLLCGPAFPHEVAGHSGGAQYLFACLSA